ncbi:MAG: biotin transporter BioY [Spirochaetaceae bacterium]|jgi:biotin transport system substrate-specific component|nr:biotin transporter BioY [Spirochaetaceae bacterium]
MYSNSAYSVSLGSRRKALFRLTLVALFAALTAAGAFISIPLPLSPVPIVLQNLLALLSGLILGPVMGSLAVILYLAVGALGAPVFAGGTGGFVRFLGPTGGFLAGYVLAALVAGLFTGRPRRHPLPRLRIAAGAALGLLAVYIPGLFQLKLISGLSWPAVFAAGCLPFLPGDAVKCVAAVILTRRLRQLVADRLD